MAETMKAGDAVRATSIPDSSSTSCVEEAIQLVAARDAVYFDLTAHAWKGSIPASASIQTRAGTAKFIAARPNDGVVVCSCSGGILYLPPANVAKHPEGGFIDVSLLPARSSLVGHEEEEDAGATDDRQTEVDLRGCQLQHQDVARLSRAFAGNSFVTSLALSGNHLVDSDVALLADALAHTGCALQSLLLSYNAIGVLGSTLLATALRENTRLRVLDLSHNRISSDGVRPWLGSTLRVNRALQELRLSHNSFGDAKASELLDALAPKPESQEEMIKSQIARRRHTTAVAPTTRVLSNAGHNKLAVASEQPEEPFNSNVRVLELSDTGISDEAAQHLAHVLHKTRSLLYLDVSGNSFSSQGVLLLAHALEKNSTLNVFEFSDNRVDDAVAASAMLTAAGAHPCLNKVRFQGCFPSGDPSIAFAASSLVQSTRTISTLDLSYCLLEPPGAVALYRALATNSSLRHLALACTGMRSDAAAGVLAQALAANVALEALDVAHNLLTMRGCKLLREASALQARKVLVVLEGNTGERKPVAGTVLVPS